MRCIEAKLGAALSGPKSEIRRGAFRARHRAVGTHASASWKLQCTRLVDASHEARASSAQQLSRVLSELVAARAKAAATRGALELPKALGSRPSWPARRARSGSSGRVSELEQSRDANVALPSSRRRTALCATRPRSVTSYERLSVRRKSTSQSSNHSTARLRGTAQRARDDAILAG